MAGLIDYLGWDLTHLQYDPEENRTRFQLVAGVLEVRRIRLGFRAQFVHLPRPSRALAARCTRW